MNSHGSSTSQGTLRNSAFLFVKPQANTEATKELVEAKLKDSNIDIVKEVSIDGGTIERDGLIDQHYYSIASKATKLAASEIPVPTDKFLDFFGEPWSTVLEEEKACNALEACQRLGVSPSQLSEIWKEGPVVKLGGGFYCGKVDINGKPKLYVFNAFFLSMREKFIGDNSIHGYVVEWEPNDLPWSQFRNDLLGDTDPSSAPKGSIRRAILEEYKTLGLQICPTKSDNAVHASASPFEGLAEKVNWLGIRLEDDPFGQAILRLGIPKRKIAAWFNDPFIRVSDTGRGSIFDALENLDASDCLMKLHQLHELNQ
eukprot:Nitzschia sp. Nitz4//scaffold112_size70979//30796//31808//NITZ4_005902-RA/size70979-snap-gene-0.133-mRNA-1//1//CDS//3329533265//8463//frame0